MSQCNFTTISSNSLPLYTHENLNRKFEVRKARKDSKLTSLHKGNCSSISSGKKIP